MRRLDDGVVDQLRMTWRETPDCRISISIIFAFVFVCFWFLKQAGQARRDVFCFPGLSVSFANQVCGCGKLMPASALQCMSQSNKDNVSGRD